jgi:glycosyltransferase involved in cell wall biosynthesis
VPEVIDHGLSGFIVDSMDEAIRAVRRVGELDRAEVRAAFEARFTATRMASDYLDLYRNLASARAALRRQPVLAVSR